MNAPADQQRDPAGSQRDPAYQQKAASLHVAASPGTPPEPIWATGEGLQPGDAYLEDSLLVFTAQYHLRRGACCGSGCRHCPYRTPDR